ncbi:MAG TPA: hypothetical protein PLE19_03290 [Planctomycetota bacterium]|nr:hypothetical protein [Planctomycetota bacterium]HRR79625.1 hypothetical protein [Planctomycetota bacterium]HRT97003.1 hypothetical protein [Planctomycetota bacterium]
MAAPGAEHVILYDGVRQPWFDAAAVAAYVARWLPWLRVEVRADVFQHALLAARGHEALAGLAEDLCRVRVHDPMRPWAERRRRPLKPELDYERRLITGAARPAAGVTYDGLELQRLAFNVLPETERHQRAVHLWLTERLIATWDEADRRYHARVSLYGFPSILSTEGMVQAPARERSFYLARRLGLGEGADPGERALRHEDPRTTEVAKGYAMQALFYAFTGEPFCDEAGCRLFNAHWQREMLAAQLEGSEFCPRHAQMLEAWQAGPGRMTEDFASC